METKEQQIHAAATMAAKWWGDRLMCGDRERFETYLREAVTAELQAHGHCCLACDYDPKDILLDAVRAAGIECRGSFFSAEGILPQKHCLHVTQTELTPKEGYGNWTGILPVVP